MLRTLIIAVALCATGTAHGAPPVSVLSARCAGAGDLLAVWPIEGSRYFLYLALIEHPGVDINQIDVAPFIELAVGQILEPGGDPFAPYDASVRDVARARRILAGCKRLRLNLEPQLGEPQDSWTVIDSANNSFVLDRRAVVMNDFMALDTATTRRCLARLARGGYCGEQVRFWLRDGARTIRSVIDAPGDTLTEDLHWVGAEPWFQ